MPEPLLGRLARWANSHAWLIILTWLLLAGASVWLAATRLGINTSTTDLIADEVPYRQDNMALRHAFPVLDDVLVVVIDAPTPEQADGAAAALIDRLAPRTDLFEWVEAPAADPFFRRNGLLYMNRDQLTDLADQMATAQPLLISLSADPSLGGLFDILIGAMEASGEMPPPAQFVGFLDGITAEIEALLADQPGQLSWRRLMVGDTGPLGDGRRTVLARPRIDAPAQAVVRDGITVVRRVVDNLRLESQGITVRLTGQPALSRAELETVSRGAVMAGVLSLALVTGLLVIGLHTVRLILAVLSTLLIGLMVTAGVATLTVGSLNLISVAFAVLFVGLAVDFGIHLALRYQEALSHRPKSALATAVCGVGPALGLASLCAALGFLSFVPTAYSGLAELGVISAGGMAVALIANVTLMPALLRVLGPMPARRPVRSGDLYVAFMERHRGAILLIAALLGGGAAAVAPLVQFDVNPLNLQDPNVEAVATYRELAGDPRMSPYTVQVLTPDMGQAEAVEGRLQSLEEVDAVMSISSFLPGDQDTKLEIIDGMALFLTPLLLPLPPEDPSSTGVRDLRAAIADLPPGSSDMRSAADRLEAALAAFQLRFGDTSQGQDVLSRRLVGGLPGWLDDLALAMQPSPVRGIQDLPETLRHRWIGTDGQIRVEASPSMDVSDSADMRAFAQAALAVQDHATGTPVVLTLASDTVVTAFWEATGLTVLAIVAVLIVVLRRWDDILLTLTPLLLATVWTLAAAVLLGLSFNLANVIVLPLLFGLGVASSIHLVSRRRQHRGARITEGSTPRAVLFSALTTVASFGSLAVSPHRGMSSMGVLLTIAILSVLLATLAVLPCLMAALDARRAKTRAK